MLTGISIYFDSCMDKCAYISRETGFLPFFCLFCFFLEVFTTSFLIRWDVILVFLVVYQLPGTNLIHRFYFGIQTSIKLSGSLHCELEGCVFVYSLCHCFICVCVCHGDVFSQLMCIRQPNQFDWTRPDTDLHQASSLGLNMSLTPQSQVQLQYFVCSASKDGGFFFFYWVPIQQQKCNAKSL